MNCVGQRKRGENRWRKRLGKLGLRRDDTQNQSKLCESSRCKSEVDLAILTNNNKPEFRILEFISRATLFHYEMMKYKTLH